VRLDDGGDVPLQMDSCSAVVSNSLCLVASDEVIRPLSTPAADPRPKSFFLEGDEEEELKSETDQPSLPPKPRDLVACVAVLNNPEVRHHNTSRRTTVTSPPRAPKGVSFRSSRWRQVSR